MRDLDAVRAATRGVDAVSHQAAMVGLGVDFGDIDGLRLAQRPRDRGAAARPARAALRRSDRAREQHGRLRRGALSLRGPRRRASRPAPGRGPRGRALRTAVPDLRSAARARGGRRGRTAWIRATCMPPRSCTRSICAPRTRASTAPRSRPCATTTCTGPACRETRRTRASRASSAARSSGASRRGCSRTDGRCATSCTSATWRRRTCSRSSPAPTAPSTSRATSRIRWARWLRRSSESVRAGCASSDGRGRLPARRRAPCVRLARRRPSRRSGSAPRWAFARACGRSRPPPRQIVASRTPAAMRPIASPATASR